MLKILRKKGVAKKIIWFIAIIIIISSIIFAGPIALPNRHPVIAYDLEKPLQVSVFS